MSANWSKPLNLHSVIAAIFALCVSPLAPGSHTAYAQTIGMSLPLIKRYQPVTSRMVTGAALAVADYKSTHPDVDLKVVNDGCDIDNAPAIATELADVQIITGVLCFRVAEILVRKLNENGDGQKNAVPVIALDTRNKLLNRLRTVENLPIFEVSLPSTGEAEAVVDAIFPRFRGKAFAVVDDGSVYGRNLADAVRLLGAQVGLRPVTIANFRPLQSTQRGLIRRLQRSGVEALFVAASADDVATIASSMRGIGVDWPLAMGELGALLPYVEDTSVLPKGLMTIAPAVPQSKAAFAERLKAMDIEPDPNVLKGYAMVQLAIATLEAQQAGQDIEQVETVLGKLDFTGTNAQGTQGRADYTAFQLLQWDGERLVPVSGN